MKKVLLAVDESKGSLRAAETLLKLFPCVKPETVILLHVRRIEGWSLMDDVLLSESEIKTLNEALQGTEYQDMLNAKSDRVIAHFTSYLKDNGITGIKIVIKQGRPAEEILVTAREEGAELLILGSRSKRSHGFLMGSVSREVANIADIPVLIAK